MSADAPVFSGEFEVTRAFALPERPLDARGAPFERARLLVRVGGEPVGFVDVSLAGRALSRGTVLQAIDRELEAAVASRLGRQAAAEHDAAANGAAARSARAHARSTSVSVVPSVSVVVCTRDRAHALARCLHALARIERAGVEFLIVDNAPRDDSTLELVRALADPRFHYVREPRAGLSRARNRGLARARGEIVAFTDDDVRVDPLWLEGVVRGFARRADVACVTGLVASASLEAAAERFFDARVWWSESCEARVFDARTGPAGSALHPYAAGTLGTGANFAVRASVARAIGAFDESLGAGSRCEGGEDLDMFVRLIRAGHAIAYEPAALVWHEHRAGPDELRRQMYCYGKALSAYLFKYLCARASARDVLARAPHGLAHLARLWARSRRVGAQTGLAYGPALAEARGLAAGPLAYLLARREQDPARRRAVAP